MRQELFLVENIQSKLDECERWFGCILFLSQETYEWELEVEYLSSSQIRTHRGVVEERVCTQT